jgi:20S proteasome subunit alpha 6
MEAVKQGAAAVGVASPRHVVLAALKRTPGELAAHQRKLLAIDEHIGVGLAGLTSDARVLTRYMRATALASRMDMARAIPTGRLVADIADKAQKLTHEYGGRPFGVGLLVAGYDQVREEEEGPYDF